MYARRVALPRTEETCSTLACCTVRFWPLWVRPGTARWFWWPTGNTQRARVVGPNATVVHLNLTPGVVDAVTTLSALVEAVPVEQALVMQPLREGP